MKARHELLLVSIGTFPEEDEAYQRVMKLLWALPLIVILSGVMDIFFIFIYMKCVHPWKIILVEAEKTKKKQKKSKCTLRRIIPNDFM